MSPAAEQEVSPPPVALTIAGSDPSGGAGLQADLKTFHRLGVFGTSAVTLVTVQNTQRVSAVVPLDPDLIVAQIAAVTDDLPVGAAKTGALGTAAAIEAVCEALRAAKFPLVVDPVMISKHGDRLMDDAAIEQLRDHLLPQATILTPNRFEAEALLGQTLDSRSVCESAARRLLEWGPGCIVLKAGRREDQAATLLADEQQLRWFEHRWLETTATHGSGCVLSAAITAALAKDRGLVDAVQEAVALVHEAIERAPGLGHGRGPLQMLAGVPRG